MSTITTTTSLTGTSTGTLNEAMRYADLMGAKRPDFTDDYLAAVFELAPLVGLRADVVVAQSVHETNAWKSDWWIDRGNPAGIGITGTPSQDNASGTWATGRDAAKCHLIHLIGYVRGSAPPVAEPWIALDPRWSALMKSGMAGTAQTIGAFGNGVWATDPDYADKWVSRFADVFNRFTVPVEEPPAGGSPVKIPTQHSVPKPVIYDLAVDYARYGLAEWQAQEILSHRFENRNGGDPRFEIDHIQDGTTRGSLSYWVGVQASSTVMIQKDGSILRVIPEQHGPWTNGDVKYPTAEAKELIALGGNANNWSLTIEAEGGPWDAMPQAQEDAIVWQMEEWAMKYPKVGQNLIKSILAHYMINTVDKQNCGLYRNRVAARIAAWLEMPAPTPEPEPVPMPLYPRGMSRELARELYEAQGKFTAPWTSKAIGWDEDRSECQSWLVWGKAQLDEGDAYNAKDEDGRPKAEWPALVKIIRRGKTKNVHAYVYSNGAVYEKVVRKDDAA